MKRRWIIIPLAVGLMAALIAGGTALAFGGGKHGGGAGFGDSRFTERVAEILELDPDAVSDAFEQAGQELWAERVDQVLENMVERGAITEEQAAEYRGQLESGDPFMFHGRGHGHGWGHGSSVTRCQNTTDTRPAQRAKFLEAHNPLKFVYQNGAISLAEVAP